MKYNNLGMPDFDRMLGPAFQLQRSMQRMQDAVMPRSLRMMLDMQDGLRGATVAGLVDRMGLDRLHTGLAPHERLFSSMTAVTDAVRAHDLVSSMSTAAKFAIELRDVLAPGLALAASPTFQLAQNLGNIMPEPLHLQWQEHLVRGLAPSFDVLSRWSDEPVGVLAFLSKPDLGASLTWLGEEEQEQTSAAALLPEGRYLPRLAIDTVVHCIVCDAELIQTEETLRWRGNRIRIDITVVPICATCLQEAHDYPGHILDALDDPRRPKLRLVHTEGKSDGVPRGNGKLRLVRPDQGGGDVHSVESDEIDHD